MYHFIKDNIYSLHNLALYLTKKQSRVLKSLDLWKDQTKKTPELHNLLPCVPFFCESL